jgi:hypothetical protein
MRKGSGAKDGPNANPASSDSSEKSEPDDIGDATESEPDAMDEVLRKASSLPHKKGGTSEMLIIPGWALETDDDYVS